MSKSIVGEWAKDKLDRLGSYLHEYTKIMRKQSSWCEGFYYVDAFAGPGQHEIRQQMVANDVESFLDVADFGQSQVEQQQFLAGSPRVALDIEHPFSGYIFIERSPDRVTDLESLKSEYGKSRKIVIRKTDCNSYLLDKVVSNSNINWKTNRAVVFLDPFGMQVPWSTLAALGETGAIEVFLNFPVGMAIQRLLPRDTSKLTDKRREMLNNYFGSPDWYDVVYESAPSLFGDDIEYKVEQSGKSLLKWYSNRLKSVFGEVSKAALIRNTKGGHLYYLMLATPNSTGVKIANHILSAGESV